MDLRQLKNIYYILRHGQSLANVQDLIISHPDNGLDDFGLSEVGRKQVEHAVSRGAKTRALDRETLILASDFLRTRHTAEIAAALLGLSHHHLYPAAQGTVFRDLGENRQ